MTTERLLGAHMPTSRGLAQAIRDGKSIGCTAIQLFTSNPRQWRGKTITPAIAHEFKEASKETGIHHIISHDTYLVNLCATNDEAREKSTQNLIEEMIRCHTLGIHHVISHMGAHMGQGEEEGLKIVAERAQHILDETPDNVFLCMETTAGQGSALNYRFEHFAYILERCPRNKRLVICLDTCHVFVAGYDISTPEGYEKTFEEFDRLVGLERLKVIHCNDSKKPLGSKVDRHEHLGKGYIGETAFKMLVNDKRFKKVPIIIETPLAESMHQSNLDYLKSLIEN